MTRLTLVFAVALLAVQDHPLAKGFDDVTPDLLKSYLGTLASDEFEGRCAGFPGNDKAANFIAARMKEAGLKPMGDVEVGGAKTYFQPFLFDEGRHLTRNCVGLLEGSDSTLKDEVVVIGAHFDHVGRKGQHKAGQLGKAEKDDVIWNGADDNGSGTTTVLGVLRLFAASKARPKRSILFIWFSAEEWGLLGSKWYVDHPVIPLAKTIAMLNLDMTGRTDDEAIANCYGVETGAGDPFTPIVERAMKTSEGFTLKIEAAYGPGSDHVPFAEKQIPICGFGEKGPCPDYHKVTDHVEKIAFGYMVKIARAAGTALFDIANLEKRPAWNAAFKLPVPKDDGKPRVGAYLSALEDDELAALELKKRGALKVNGVVAGGAGEKAGLVKGDILIALGGTSFDAEDPRGTLTETLDKVVRGTEMTLEIIREGKRQELRMVWPEVKK
jgi:hypothetical protein